MTTFSPTGESLSYRESQQQILARCNWTWRSPDPMPAAIWNALTRPVHERRPAVVKERRGIEAAIRVAKRTAGK